MFYFYNYRPDKKFLKIRTGIDYRSKRPKAICMLLPTDEAIITKTLVNLLFKLWTMRHIIAVEYYSIF